MKHKKDAKKPVAAATAPEPEIQAAPIEQQPDIDLTETHFGKRAEPKECSAPNSEPEQTAEPEPERLDAVSFRFWQNAQHAVLTAQQALTEAQGQMKLVDVTVQQQFGLQRGDQVTPDGLIVRSPRGPEPPPPPAGA
jgi:hypothetical protein